MNKDNAVNLPARKTETLPQCDFSFVNGTREEKRNVKAAQPQRRYIHGKGAAKNLKTSLKTTSEKALHTRTYKKIVCKSFFFPLFFLKLHNKDIIQGTGVTFTFTPSFSKA